MTQLSLRNLRGAVQRSEAFARSEPIEDNCEVGNFLFSVSQSTVLRQLIGIRILLRRPRSLSSFVVEVCFASGKAANELGCEMVWLFRFE